MQPYNPNPPVPALTLASSDRGSSPPPCATPVDVDNTFIPTHLGTYPTTPQDLKPAVQPDNGDVQAMPDTLPQDYPTTRPPAAPVSETPAPADVAMEEGDVQANGEDLSAADALISLASPPRPKTNNRDGPRHHQAQDDVVQRTAAPAQQPSWSVQPAHPPPSNERSPVSQDEGEASSSSRLDMSITLAETFLADPPFDADVIFRPRPNCTSSCNFNAEDFFEKLRLHFPDGQTGWLLPARDGGSARAATDDTPGRKVGGSRGESRNNRRRESAERGTLSRKRKESAERRPVKSGKGKERVEVVTPSPPRVSFQRTKYYASALSQMQARSTTSKRPIPARTGRSPQGYINPSQVNEAAAANAYVRSMSSSSLDDGQQQDELVLSDIDLEIEPFAPSDNNSPTVNRDARQPNPTSRGCNPSRNGGKSAGPASARTDDPANGTSGQDTGDKIISLDSGAESDSSGDPQRDTTTVGSSTQDPAKPGTERDFFIDAIDAILVNKPTRSLAIVARAIDMVTQRLAELGTDKETIARILAQASAPRGPTQEGTEGDVIVIKSESEEEDAKTETPPPSPKKRKRGRSDRYAVEKRGSGGGCRGRRGRKDKSKNGRNGRNGKHGSKHKRAVSDSEDEVSRSPRGKTKSHRRRNRSDDDDYLSPARRHKTKGRHGKRRTYTESEDDGRRRGKGHGKRRDVSESDDDDVALRRRKNKNKEKRSRARSDTEDDVYRERTKRNGKRRAVFTTDDEAAPPRKKGGDGKSKGRKKEVNGGEVKEKKPSGPVKVEAKVNGEDKMNGNAVIIV
ncbi:hypothetical protein HK104_000698 [Borealophlyctis nickersoniae]|nr:hypothetical protein HK104_000698 [Borealophlyctis nickersoniae]